MVASNTEIANLALGHIGISRPIGNMDTERSVEAQSCRTFYDVVLDDLINEIPWSHCKKFANLQLVSGSASAPVSSEWIYAYRYPPDCLQFIRIVSYRGNNDTRQSRVPYTIAADDVGQLIYTNWPTSSLITPQCQYTFRNANVQQFPPNFVMAFSLGLALRILPMVSAGDPNNVSPKIAAEFTKVMKNAADANVNEEQRPEEPQSEFIRARDYGDRYGSTGEAWQATNGGFTIE